MRVRASGEIWRRFFCTCESEYSCATVLISHEKTHFFASLLAQRPEEYRFRYSTTFIKPSDDGFLLKAPLALEAGALTGKDLGRLKKLSKSGDQFNRRRARAVMSRYLSEVRNEPTKAAALLLPELLESGESSKLLKRLKKAKGSPIVLKSVLEVVPPASEWGGKKPFPCLAFSHLLAKAGMTAKGDFSRRRGDVLATKSSNRI